MIPAETDISTFSLFEVMDYCLTVRGNVGIEASAVGIPVLTAGVGPYDNKGFTVDSESREEYLGRISRIQELKPLSAAQRDLAERFAFGYFMLRTLPLTSITMKYHESCARHLAEGRINIRSLDEWYHAADLRAMAEWMGNSSQKEFLMPLPEMPVANRATAG